MRKLSGCLLLLALFSILAAQPTRTEIDNAADNIQAIIDEIEYEDFWGNTPNLDYLDLTIGSTRRTELISNLYTLKSEVENAPVTTEVLNYLAQYNNLMTIFHNDDDLTLDDLRSLLGAYSNMTLFTNVTPLSFMNGLAVGTLNGWMLDAHFLLLSTPWYVIGNYNIAIELGEDLLSGNGGAIQDFTEIIAPTGEPTTTYTFPYPYPLGEINNMQRIIDGVGDDPPEVYYQILKGANQYCEIPDDCYYLVVLFRGQDTSVDDVGISLIEDMPDGTPDNILFFQAEDHGVFQQLAYSSGNIRAYTIPKETFANVDTDNLIMRVFVDCGNTGYGAEAPFSLYDEYDPTPHFVNPVADIQTNNDVLFSVDLQDELGHEDPIYVVLDNTMYELNEMRDRDGTFMHLVIDVEEGSHSYQFQTTFMNETIREPETGDFTLEIGTSNPTGLVAYYPFNGDANDESGNGHDGIVVGATLTTDRFGNPDSAYEFDGDNDMIIAQDTPNLIVAAHSLTCWVNASGSDGIIVGKGENGNWNAPYALRAENNRFIYTVREDCPNIYTAESNEFFENNTWYHLAAVYTGSEISLYINRELQETISTGSENLADQSLNLTIGANSDNLGNFAGFIDEVRVYNLALTETEIQNLYYNESPAPNAIVTPSSIMETLQPNSTSQQSIYISNTGNSDLIYSAINSSRVPWLILSNASGSVSPGGTETVGLTFDTTGLTQGTYWTDINVVTNDPDASTVSIPVSLEVLDVIAVPDSPENVQIEVTGDDVVLSWDESDADGYKVYASDDVDTPQQSLVTTQGSFSTSNGRVSWTTAIPDVEMKYYCVTAVNNNSIPPGGMVYIPAGTFQMGDTHGLGDADELPVHTVQLDAFYIGRYEVTQQEWIDVMGSNPSYFTGDMQRPVEQINWYDAVRFCNYRSIQEDLDPAYTVSGDVNPDNWGTTFNPNVNWNVDGYRLPTEAEWEYAARGATNDPDYLYAGSDALDNVAWQSVSSTHTVGEKQANSLGIHDMSGNVYEWCWDLFGSSYYTTCEIQGTVCQPLGPDNGVDRIKRGGSWSSNGNQWRVACRENSTPVTTGNYIGLRLCRSIPQEGPSMILVPSGSFQMGRVGVAEPVHTVNLDAFYIGKYEVTHQEVIDVFNWAYQQGYVECSSSTVMNAEGDQQEFLDLDEVDGNCAIDWNDSQLVFGGSSTATDIQCPCIEITWFGSVAYCNYMSLLEGMTPCYDLSNWSCDWNANGYRLPTEAEWEYSARGATNIPDFTFSGSNNCDEVRGGLTIRQIRPIRSEKNRLTALAQMTRAAMYMSYAGTGGIVTTTTRHLQITPVVPILARPD